MTKPDRLELAASLVAALHAATRGRPGRFRRISDCAEGVGIAKADVDGAVQMAEGGVSSRRTSMSPP